MQGIEVGMDRRLELRGQEEHGPQEWVLPSHGVPRCQHHPGPDASWELKGKVIGNGLPWGYPSMFMHTCVCLHHTHRASYKYPHGALATKTNTEAQRG